MTETSCMVRLRERGAKRHRLLGKGRLTDRWIHAVMFEGEGRAREAALWMLERNPDTLDSAQVIDAHSKRVLGRITIEQVAGG